MKYKIYAPKDNAELVVIENYLTFEGIKFESSVAEKHFRESNGSCMPAIDVGDSLTMIIGFYDLVDYIKKRGLCRI